MGFTNLKTARPAFCDKKDGVFLSRYFRALLINGCFEVVDQFGGISSVTGPLKAFQESSGGGNALKGDFWHSQLFVCS